jgi:hypothetical protein
MGYIPNFADETLGKEISKKSGSDLHLKDGILKVGFLRSREGNPLFEIARLINENKIKAIDAGGIIGPKIPDLIIGLKKMIERKRVKDPSFPRIKIKGYLRPEYLAEKISEQSEYKYKHKHGDLLKYYTKGYDYYGRKDQRNFVSAMDQMKLNRKDNSFVYLEKLYPEGFAKGYIPNFADPLKEAIGREMSAGVPASQIYVDQNSSLKNAMNPMGLMVANRRDEPSGGMQGISRARKEGANPMLYGAAGGFVPNYAPIPAMPTMGSVMGSVGNSPAANKLNAALNKAALELQNGSTTINQVIAELGKIKPKATRLTANAQALAQKYSEELLQRQQAVATRILESNAGRKLAAQLDKVYIEYNKSQKSAADLDAAQKKAAAILQKTSLSQSSQRAIVSSTGSLAGSRLTAQPQAAGDLLAKMFGLQTALSLLTGATSNTENAFATAANAITSTASSFTSVYLMFEGLKNAGGKLGSLFGAFGGKLGIYAGGAYALYEGFNLIAKNLDSTNASINNASFAMENFAKVAAGATVNFGTLSESQKKRIQTSREGLIAGARTYEKTTLDAKGDTRTRLMQASFEGYGNELKTKLNDATDQALAVGVSFDVVFNRIRKAAESGNKITAEEVENMVNEFKTLAEEIAKVKPIDIIKNFGLYKGGQNEAIFNKIKNLTPKELEAQLGDFTEKAGQGSPELQTLIKSATGAQNKTSQQENLRKLKEALDEVTKTQKEAVGAAIETANLSLLKQQLENRIAYKKALFEASSAEEYSLELQKEMLSVSEKDRTLADYKLQSLQAAKKLTSDQADATINALKESELIQKKLEGMSPGGKIDPKEFDKLTSAAEKVSDIIREQGGYTEDAKNKTQDLLAKTGLLPDQYGIILDIIKETNDELSRQAALQNQLNALSNIQKATLEASNFVYEKRSESVTREYDRLSKSAEQRKRNLDLELEAFKVQKEREKIGGGAGGNLSIDRQIFEKEEYTINAKLKIDQEDLLNQLRKTLSESAMKVGFAPQDASAISTLTSKGDFEEIATIIEEAEKEAKIQKIEAALEEKEVKLNLLSYEIDVTKASADYWYDTVASSTQAFAGFLNSVIPGFIDENGPPDALGVKNDGLAEAQEKLKISMEAAKTSAAQGIEEVRNLGRNFTGLFDTIGDTFVGVDQTGQEAANSIGNLKNALLSAGASLTTFANLVRGVFTSLPETIAQNKFAMLTATDTQSIIGNAVEARRNSILAQGPASAGTIAQAADATAIYEKELEIKRAITAEDKINGEFELQKLKEILPLRMQLLEAETNEEREAIIDKIIAKEKQRLPVLERLKAAMVSTPEQRTQELEDSLVNASVQFRDNLIDGVSKAIEEGGRLEDVLRSAALDFARSMTQAGLKNVTSQIGGLFGFAKGGLVPNMASGGMINGGSGSKDDIPAMLMGGEYVLKKTAVQKYGSDFLDALNNGRLGGYAKGGEVDKLPNQTGAGGFFASGLYDTGSIVGKEDLLRFATQSYTSGARDVVTSGENFASVNLEPESLRLTNFGRTNDRMFQATQSAKEEAFGLYGQQLQQEQDYKKQLEEDEKQKAAQRKAEKKALRNQLIMMAVSAFAGPVLGAAGAGFKAAFGAAGGMQNFLPAAGAGLKGIFTGGGVGGVNVGGLGNLFKGVGQGLTGNFAEAGNYFKLSQISNMDQLSQSYAKGNPNFTGFLDKAGFEYAPRASVVNEGMGANGGLAGGGIFSWIQNLGKAFGGGSGGENEFASTGQDIKPSIWERITGKRNVIDPYSLISEDEMAELRKDPVLGYGVQDPRSWKRRATGGSIPTTTGIDTVPTMLSGGEFIMNRAASQNIGAGNLQSLNAGASSLPTEEKTEELNDKLIAKLDELIEATSGSGDITINVEASTGKTSEEGGSSENEKRVQMARLIKDMVLKVIQDEKRLGGALRRG